MNDHPANKDSYREYMYRRAEERVAKLETEIARREWLGVKTKGLEIELKHAKKAVDKWM